MARQDKKGITFFMFISQKFENPPIDLFLKLSGHLYDILQYAHKSGPAQNPKKNRVQESVIVEESSTITLTWTLFMTA